MDTCRENLFFVKVIDRSEVSTFHDFKGKKNPFRVDLENCRHSRYVSAFYFA